MRKSVPLLPVLLAALLAGCQAMSYLGYRISPDYPKDESAELELPGLEQPVEIFLDDLGVPHLRAASEPDLLRAVGFVHGRARFFQMDTIRRYARGRLAELVGEQPSLLGNTTALDASMRAWGFDRAAREEAAALEPPMRRLLQAYADGVNQALARYRPVEYRLLGVEPEPWQVADTFAVGYMVGWGITHNWRHELCRLLLALEVGWERAEQIFPSRPWAGPTSLAGTQTADPALPPAVVEEVKSLFPGRPPHRMVPEAQPPAAAAAPPSGASNGWVLGGAHTRSGQPLLVGDPHLPHTLPSLAFQQQLSCPEFDVIGMTVPGIPYVLMGHNRRVAWTMTAAVADVVDLYLERPAPGHPGQVLGPGGPEPVQLHDEVIRIRRDDRFEEKTITQRRTRRGPLLDDMFPGLLPEHAPLVSVHGIEAAAAASLQALRRAMRAADVEQLQQALSGMMSPVNVVAAADRAGGVAMFPTGTVPVRRHHRGTFPVPAWVERYQWQELAAPEQLPRARGGREAVFVHANNLLRPAGAGDVLYQVDSAPSYRLERIQQLLRAKHRHDRDSSTAIQADTVLLRARRLLPVMLRELTPADAQVAPEAGVVLERLRRWDGDARADSVACAVFWAWYRQVLIAALADEVGPAGLRFLLSFRYFMNAADQWFADPDHPVWDVRHTGGPVENRAVILRRAWSLALAWLRDRLGPDPAAWQWGRLHFTQIDHPFGSRAAAFNLERWAAPGASASVWKSHFDMGDEQDPFRAKYGPVYRMVVDLADIEHAWWIVDTGSSGWPRSPHYADQVPDWQKARLAPMVSAWPEVRKRARARLLLQPAAGQAQEAD